MLSKKDSYSILITWQNKCSIVDIHSFGQKWEIESWTQHLTETIKNFLGPLGLEQVQGMISKNLGDDPLKISSKVEGVHVDEFIVTKVLQVPSSLDENQVANMSTWWIMQCFNGPHGGVVMTINVMDFYLDGMSEHPKLYSEKTQGLVVIMSSKDIVRGTGETYHSFCRSAHGGLVHTIKWNTMMNGGKH